VSKFDQTASINERTFVCHSPRESVMHDARRYRSNVVECLLAAQVAQRQSDRKLHLSLATSWLSLARLDEEIDNLLPSWKTTEPTQTDHVWRTASDPFVSGNRHWPAQRESRAA
jgi:hypothetical protein